MDAHKDREDEVMVSHLLCVPLPLEDVEEARCQLLNDLRRPSVRLVHINVLALDPDTQLDEGVANVGLHNEAQPNAVGFPRIAVRRPEA